MRSMGVFYVPIEVANPQEARFEHVNALVDAGASYLTLPAPLLESLSIPRITKRSFTLGDGRTAEYDVGVTLLRIDSAAFPVLCVFGDPRSEPLLGAVALETFGSAPDPVAQRLMSVPGLLARFSPPFVCRGRRQRRRGERRSWGSTRTTCSRSLSAWTRMR